MAIAYELFVGVALGIALAYAFPRLPKSLKQISDNFQKLETNSQGLDTHSSGHSINKSSEEPLNPDVSEDDYLDLTQLNKQGGKEMKPLKNKIEDNEILQNLYEKGMVDFEGDEEDLTLQVPTNIIKTGKYVCDVYRAGYEEAQKLMDETLKNIIDEIDKFTQDIEVIREDNQRRLMISKVELLIKLNDLKQIIQKQEEKNNEM